ncbi:MAG: hypothetical protein ACRC28_07060 [Clostridium sp.]|uniref:hypothetical protein n=1 Tax=Clostridium sp. TaxID=1506 RepID=UPI003F2DA8EA
MVDDKKEIEKIRGEIREKLSNESIQKELVRSFKVGLAKYANNRKAEGIDVMESYVSSKGIERVGKIGNEICNNKNFETIGVKVDVILTCKIPSIKIDNIMLTIKSLEKPENIVKKTSKYIKEYSALNRALDPQLDMLDTIDENIRNTTTYYGIILYHVSSANILEYMKFVFLDAEAKRILFEVKVNDSVINSENKINHKDLRVVSEDSIKGKSLKGLLKIK